MINTKHETRNTELNFILLAGKNSIFFIPYGLRCDHGDDVKHVPE
jgi:hypothetical protein